MADDAADRAADRAAHRRGRRLGLRSGLALLGGWFGVVWKVLAVPPSLTDPEPRPGERFCRALLALAIACERSDGEHLRDAAERCAISPDQASDCHMQALSWAIQIQD